MSQAKPTRPGFCDSCPINKYTNGYVPPHEVEDSNLLIVGEAAGDTDAKLSKPFAGRAGAYLNQMLRLSNAPRQQWNVINCIGCHPKDGIFPGSDKWKFTSKEVAREAIKYCSKNHLEPFLFKKKWNKIVALGNQALKATTGKIGISTWRGSPLPFIGTPYSAPTVIPTYHPSYVGGISKFFPVVITDLLKSFRQPKLDIQLNPPLDPEWKPKKFSFDLEWNKKGEITVCGITDKRNTAKVWKWGPEVKEYLKRVFEEAEDLIGWNIITADLPYFEDFGWKIKARLHDTMLKQHLVQPDYPHSLAFSASLWTNFPFWKGRAKEEEDSEAQDTSGAPQWKTWDKPWAIPNEYGGYGDCTSDEEAFLRYNAYDNIYSYEVDLAMDRELAKNDLTDLYWNVSLPIALISRDMCKPGWKLDKSKFDEMVKELDITIAKLDAALPEGLRSYKEEVGVNLPAPPDTYKEKSKKCRSCKKSYSFVRPNQRVVCCGKEMESGKMQLRKVIRGTKLVEVRPWASSAAVQKYVHSKNLTRKYNPKTGNETANKQARAQWALSNPEFSILNELTKAATLRKNFAKDSLQGKDRMYYDVRVHGTATGRVSVVGRRKGVDLNIQNQPEIFRKVYVPENPEQGTLNSDFKSGDNTLTAWFAEDWERLDKIQNDPNYDDHLETAIAFFGSEGVNLRKPGKIVNHGMNYGMGPKKLLFEFHDNGLYEYNIVDIKEFIAIWKNKNEKIAQWQNKTIATAERDGFLVNPFGRKRFFNMRDWATKSLAYLPSSTLADIMHRCTLALYAEKFPMEIHNLGIQQTGVLPGDWHIKTQVHDSLVTIGDDKYKNEAIDVLHNVMTQPWEELKGLSIGVSHEYSGKGGSWGDCK